MVPAGLRSFAFPKRPFDSAVPITTAEADYYLRPQYHSQRPLDALLLKVQSGFDDFITEKYSDQIAAILADWRAGVLRSPQDLRAVEAVLSPNFNGTSLLSVDSRHVRSDYVLEISQHKFAETSLGREAFLRDLRVALKSFSKLMTAEFQVTSIFARPPSSTRLPERLLTRVRYELVGAGDGFYREQRLGNWDLEWESVSSSNGQFRLSNWRVIDEKRSRSASPVFEDIAAAALGGNPSFAGQMLRGVDYWRTVLDGACGIDIYGHNGVSVADVDNDGFDDLYVCQPAGLPNRLYRNRGDGTFEDATESSGLGILENTACALFADFDNDGRQDVVVVRANGPLLFLNEGRGKFRKKADAFQFASAPQGTFTGAAVADYDRDGWLDIYFCLYAYYQGTDQYKYPLPYHDANNGPPNFMMRNSRDGTFRDVTAESGLHQNNTRYSFCCGWSDYNRDGWPDLYVVNDFGRKNLYHNNGDGTFKDVAAEAGVEDVGAGMSVSWFDHDNDGTEDLYVADMWTAAGGRISNQEVFKKDASPEVRALYRKHAMGNSLFRNRGSRKGNSSFEDRTDFAGVGMGRWAWSCDAFDFDHDGFPDIYVTNGMVSGNSLQDLNSFFWRQVVAHSPSEAKPSHDYEQGWSAINELLRADGTWSGFERNIFYANNRNGTFSDASGVVGMDFTEDGRAFALADFDQDGRQEVVLKNRNGPQLRLLHNVIEKMPPSIAFRLRGTKSNRDAIGAAVTLETATSSQTRWLQAGSGFLSQHSKDVFFGLGEAGGHLRASISWPSGALQELRDLPPGHRIWVEEGSDAVRLEPFRKRPSLPAIAPTTAETLPTTFDTWLLSPVTAPDFSLPDLAGQVHSLSSFRGKPLLLNFWVTSSAACQEDLKLLNRLRTRWSSMGLQLLAVNCDNSQETASLDATVRAVNVSFPVLRASDEVAAVYNILYRYLFDRHRDLPLPASFLIDVNGDVVKVYQGPVVPEDIEKDFPHIPKTDAERIALALPFPGLTESFEFGRNHLSYGSVFFQRGYFDQAAASFQRALREDPTSAEACYGLGSAYLNQQKTAEARESFERATRLRASYPDTVANSWNNLGLLAARDGRTDEAVTCFREAVRLSPNHLIALNNLGNAYRLQKNWTEARQTFERALEVSQGDAEANYGLAMVFAQADDTTDAYEYLQRALRSRPGYLEALNNLGILYLRTQRRDEAVAAFEECIRVAPTFDQSYLNLARVYGLEGSPEKARTILLELLKQHPDHAQARKMLAQLPQ